MNSPTDRMQAECPPETLLEEYALDRATPEQARFVADHAKHCEECRERIRVARESGARMMAALGVDCPVPRDECMDAESLALYLDRGLDAERFAAAEGHLAMCRKCQGRLVALYREVKEMEAGLLTEPPEEDRPYLYEDASAAALSPAASRPPVRVVETAEEESATPADLHRLFGGALVVLGVALTVATAAFGHPALRFGALLSLGIGFGVVAGGWTHKSARSQFPAFCGRLRYLFPLGSAGFLALGLWGMGPGFVWFTAAAVCYVTTLFLWSGRANSGGARNGEIAEKREVLDTVEKRKRRSL